MKYLNQNYPVVMVVALLLFMSYAHAGNYHDDYAKKQLLAKSEKIVLDAVVLRPVGLVTTVAGSAVYIVSLPFSLLGGNEAEVREHLIKQPMQYTFTRPLGDFEY